MGITACQCGSTASLYSSTTQAWVSCDAHPSCGNTWSQLILEYTAAAEAAAGRQAIADWNKGIVLWASRRRAADSR